MFQGSSQARVFGLLQGLNRFDSQKAELLKKWKVDKSCKWLGEYKESRTQKASITNEELSGFATKYLGCIIFWTYSFFKIWMGFIRS